MQYLVVAQLAALLAQWNVKNMPTWSIAKYVQLLVASAQQNARP